MLNESYETVTVDIIIPVHNSEETIVETVKSALTQRFPLNEEEKFGPNDDPGYYNFRVDLTICCHNDGSTDNSLNLLHELEKELESKKARHNSRIKCSLIVGTSHEASGAAVARNCAVSMSAGTYLAMLDSDDLMMPTRIVEQVAFMKSLTNQDQVLLGCAFQRDPPDSTWHYAQWANTLSPKRRMLERFREVTVIQPTWMITRRRFEQLGGYLDPSSCEKRDYSRGIYKLVCSTDTSETLRLAEDLRFFHAHLSYNSEEKLHLSSNYPSVSIGDGIIKFLPDSKIKPYDRTQTKDIKPQPRPLLVYKHTPNTSQSSKTPRKLLLQLRVKAFEDLVLTKDAIWSTHGFAIWGAGRDGKDFLKSLSSKVRPWVKCFVDVDPKKFGTYCNNDLGVSIPVLHFSALASGIVEEHFAHVSKKRLTGQHKPTSKVVAVDESQSFTNLPVVVCVSMYRTHGALEKNVETIQRTEGTNLWHFC